MSAGVTFTVVEHFLVEELTCSAGEGGDSGAGEHACRYCARDPANSRTWRSEHPTDPPPQTCAAHGGCRAYRGAEERAKFFQRKPARSALRNTRRTAARTVHSV